MADGRQRIYGERRRSAPRYSARTDDRAELRAVIGVMRDVPRESTASMPDMLFLLRRLAGRLLVVADSLEEAPPAKERVLARSWQAPPARPQPIAKVVQLPCIAPRRSRGEARADKASRQLEFTL